ncbi:hypothetical protein N9F34_03915 [Alphaproteobacteria bacterium]|nr:hypothetical protein [Alphaproteobacteria bacterium]
MANAVATIRVSLHDLCGLGGTFGFDLVTGISGLGCKFIDLSEDFGRTELMVMGKHVHALHAVKQKGVRGRDGQTGIDPMERLRAIVVRHREETLDENRFEGSS